MERRPSERIIEVVWPIFVVPFLVLKATYTVLFGWWLSPWIQRSANEELWRDVQANLYFLAAGGNRVKTPPTQVLPHDYASISIEYGNVRFWITRGRGELNVSLAPRHMPNETSELSVVLAALESTEVSKQQAISRFSDIEERIRPRIDELNSVFSPEQYLAFKERLIREKENVRVLIRQAEWVIRRRMSGLR